MLRALLRQRSTRSGRKTSVGGSSSFTTQTIGQATSTKVFSLAENIMAQIHRLMGHTVLVMNVFSIGQWVHNKAPTSVLVTFGSVTQNPEGHLLR